MGRYIYRIMDVFPRPDLGGFGFGVELDRNYARKALRKQLPKSVYREFDKLGRQIIMGAGLDMKFPVTPYNFYDDTFLLQFCKVPGDACDLGVDPRECEELKHESGRSPEYDPLNYTPHNVDYANQAFTLLALWTHWANKLAIVLRK